MVVEHIVQVGASVLETLTTGMYVEPFDALREYLQNSADAIRAAVPLGVLRANECGRIRITISPNDRSIAIRDNGTGIPAGAVLDKLLDVGVSEKTIGTASGFRGIGRLAGLAYCSRLVFMTRASGENSISTVTFDANKLRECLIPSNARGRTLQDVLLGSCEPDSEIAPKKPTKGDESYHEHFFEVRLEGIVPGACGFLDWKLVEGYLSQTAPVSLNQHFAFAPKVSQWASSQCIAPPEIVTQVVCNGDQRLERTVFRPYSRITYETSTGVPVKIRDIQFFPEIGATEAGYWGWYGVSDTPGVISDESVAGLRIRKDNIAIGPGSVRMDEIFSKSATSNDRFNRYLVGEVHVTSTKVIPNARRDGFEHTAEWLEIEAKLVEFARDRAKEIRVNSKTRNLSLDKLLRPVDKVASEAEKRALVGVVDKQERDGLLSKIDTQIEKIAEAEKGERDENEIQRLKDARQSLDKARSIIQDAPYRVAKLKSSLDRRERSIIEDVLTILRDTLDAKAYEQAENSIMSKYGVMVSEKGGASS